MELFSIYHGPITNVTPEKNPISLSEVYSIVSSPKLAGIISQIRALATEEGAEAETSKKELKSRLPFVTYGGIFDYRNMDPEGKKKSLSERSATETDPRELSKIKRELERLEGKKGLLDWSGLVNMDLDHITEGGFDPEELKKRLSRDPRLGARLLFLSPSGDGIKLVVKSRKKIQTPEDYRGVFKAVCNYLREEYRLPFMDKKNGALWGIDRGLTNPLSGCYLSHDPEAILNTSGDFDPTEYEEKREEYIPKNNGFFPSSSPREDVEIVLGRIEEKKLDITGDQEEWVTLGYAFAKAFGESGRGYFHRVSQYHPKYTPKETDYKYDKCLVNPRADIGTFFGRAREAGIDTYTGTSLQARNEEEKEIRRAIRTDKTKKAENAHHMEQNENKTQSETREKYSEMLLFEDFSGFLRKAPEGVRSGYELEDPETGEEMPLTFPRGEVCIIGGLSGHCKSVFMRNLFVNMRSTTEGDLLYFTYEESKRQTYRRIFSAYVQEDRLPGDNYPEEKEIERKKESFSELLREGKFRIYAPDYTSREIIEAVKYYKEKGRTIGAVFIDHIQMLTSGERTAGRREEMLAIIQPLQEFVKEENFPVIIACQLNRQATSPRTMGANNLAESADLTRFAGLIVNLWNSEKDRDLTDQEWQRSKEKERLEKKGFISGERGKLYARIDKTREEGDNFDMVLDFNGSRIARNEDLPTGGPDRNLREAGKALTQRERNKRSRI